MPKQRYIRVGTQRIPVSEEAYLDIMRPIWAAKKKAQRDKDDGYTVESLDELYETTGFEYPSGDPSVEEIVELMDMRERLSKALLELTRMDQALINARYYQDKSERQLSAETGIPRSIIQRLEKQILAKLYAIITGK